MYVYLILGKTTYFSSKKISLAENHYEKHVSNKIGWVLYYKVDVAIKSYAISIRLAAPLMDSSIVQALEWFSLYSITGTTVIFGHIETLFF